MLAQSRLIDCMCWLSCDYYIEGMSLLSLLLLDTAVLISAETATTPAVAGAKVHLCANRRIGSGL